MDSIVNDEKDQEVNNYNLENPLLDNICSLYSVENILSEYYDYNFASSLDLIATLRENLNSSVESLLSIFDKKNIKIIFPLDRNDQQEYSKYLCVIDSARNAQRISLKCNEVINFNYTELTIDNIISKMNQLCCIVQEAETAYINVNSFLFPALEIEENKSGCAFPLKKGSLLTKQYLDYDNLLKEIEAFKREFNIGLNQIETNHEFKQNAEQHVPEKEQKNVVAEEFKFQNIEYDDHKVPQVDEGRFFM